MLTKRTPLWNGYVPDYTGFEVPNRYVVGYAFDVNGHFRDMDVKIKYLLANILVLNIFMFLIFLSIYLSSNHMLLKNMEKNRIVGINRLNLLL